MVHEGKLLTGTTKNSDIYCTYFANCEPGFGQAPSCSFRIQLYGINPNNSPEKLQQKKQTFKGTLQSPLEPQETKHSQGGNMFSPETLEGFRIFLVFRAGIEEFSLMADDRFSL